MKLLNVDLNKGKVIAEEFDEDLRKKYIGGWGIGVKILWDELKANVNPLGPENIMVVSIGPFTRASVVGSGNIFYEFKSPLTGLWGESRSGGEFGSMLGKTGFEALVIRGKASKPVYLFIKNGEAEIRDATELWGKTVYETTDLLTKGRKDISVACIGPAGENKVLFAAIMNDYGRAAGRCGGGAIMGAKNLKAIAVTGNVKAKISDPEQLKQTIKGFATKAQMLGAAVGIGRDGTLGLSVRSLYPIGGLPARNFKTSYQGDVNKVNEKALAKYLLKKTFCHSCVLGCGRYSEVREGKYKTEPGDGPEYEAADMLGPNCMVDDMEAIIHASYLCNTLGLDIISTGSVIAFAMESFEKGYLTKKDTGGLELEWGNPDVVIKLIKLIANQEGIGKILAQGVRKAAMEITKRNPKLTPANDFALHVKGLEVPAHDPRIESKSYAIQYAITPRGACHIHPGSPAGWDTPGMDSGLTEYGLPPSPKIRLQELGVGRGKAYRLFALHGELTGILGSCAFYSMLLTPDLMAQIYSLITGEHINGGELLKVAERVWNLKRCFNIREGASRKDDTIPKRLSEQIVGGLSSGKAIEHFEAMIDEVYEAFEWDKKTGKPNIKKIKELGLEEVLKEL